MGAKTKLVTLVVIVAIALLAAFILQSQAKSFQFKAEQDGVEFYSDESDPFEHLHALKDKRDFTVVLALKEQGHEQNAIMGQALNEMAVVLTANRKDVVVLAKVYGADEQLAYCQTNKGDVRTNEPISVEECQQTLTHLNNQVLIEVYQPNYLLGKSRVVLEPNQIKIQPKNKTDITLVPHTLMTALYPNTNEIINSVNQRASDVIDSLPTQP